MNTQIRKEYQRLRSIGWTAGEALRAAKVRFAFDQQPSLRLTVEPDEDGYDASYVYTWDALSRDQQEHEENAILLRADAEGVWSIQTERYCPFTDEWLVVDSIGGFIGDEWEDSGYDIDIMAAGLDALAE